MGGLTTAEKNRRKRERKKKEREARRKQEEQEAAERKKRQEHGKDVNGADGDTDPDGNDDIVVEYVAEEVKAGMDVMESVLQRFQERASVVTEDEADDEHPVKEEEGGKKRVKKEDGAEGGESVDDDDDDDDEYETDEDEEMVKNRLSKRKLRGILRPSVADLKRRVKRPDLVEAHDITADDPDFLIELKGAPGTVPVPRHWGRKRKYLQGKRGYEKQPFELPDFIIKTGIAEVRDTVAEAEAGQSAKEKNRARVAPKMGAMDVDYGTLYEAFFKHQTKPTNLTKIGDLYYEGKELETQNTILPGGPYSKELCEALGMTYGDETQPPPWLVGMQRYGPPPSYPNLKIPGLNAPLPNSDCKFGYHEGGWGQPPVDNFGRPLYGGNPFDKPGTDDEKNGPSKDGLVTSDGKTIGKSKWGALPDAENVAGGDEDDDDDDDEDDSSDDEMEESSEEEEEDDDDGDDEDEDAKDRASGAESVLPAPPGTAPTATDLRKQAGDETPVVTDGKPKQLYTILGQKSTSTANSGQVFGSEVAYVMPPEGAESVLSKARPKASLAAGSADASGRAAKRAKRNDDDDEEEEIAKNFKF